MLADAQKSKSKAKKKKKKESKKGRVQSLSHTLCCLLLFHSSSCYMPHILCCSVGHFDYFFFFWGGGGGTFICTDVRSWCLWQCFCGVGRLYVQLAAIWYWFLLLFVWFSVVVVGFCLSLFYRIFLEPRLSKSAGMVSGWCSANISRPFFFFFF